MERRDFIKRSCTACLLVGTGTLLTTLASCSTAAIYKTPIVNNLVTVPLSLFETAEIQLVRPKDYEYDVAIRKNKDGGYTALLMRCTHADNPVINNDKGYTCPLHGSNFDLNGKVTHGPAERPLMRLPLEKTTDNLLIKLNPNP